LIFYALHIVFFKKCGHASVHTALKEKSK